MKRSRMTIEEPVLTMTSALTLDEELILREISGTDTSQLPDTRIEEIAKHHDMTPDRVKNTLASLHDKGIIYLPKPGVKTIKKLDFSCHQCGHNWTQTADSPVAYVVCPFCILDDTVTKVPPEKEKE
jgi:hypothetical protein